jgi:hypothetical protein
MGGDIPRARRGDIPPMRQLRLDDFERHVLVKAIMARIAGFTGLIADADNIDIKREIRALRDVLNRLSP